jgi:type IV secretion system protein VirD4
VSRRPRVRPPRARPGGPAPRAGPPLTGGELLAAVAGAVVGTLAFLLWASGGLAAFLFGPEHRWPAMGLGEIGHVMGHLPRHLGDPAAAWPTPLRRLLPGSVACYAAFGLVLLLVTAALAAAVRLRAQLGLDHRRDPGSSRWAGGRELHGLTVPRPVPRRLVLGRAGGRLLAAEPGHSVAVVGATQTMKTTGFCVPAILEWDGPVLATSVKSDLLHDTWRARAARGRVWVYDPSGAVRGVARSGWTPLAACRTWRGAQQTADVLATAGGTPRNLENGDFWVQSAKKLLAPILFAAASSGATMADVMRWINTQEPDELQAALAEAADLAGAGSRAHHDVLTAASWARASFAREPRIRSSVFTTAETVLQAYEDPVVLDSAMRPEISADRLLDGGAGTLYVCAPLHEQDRLRPVLTALVAQVLHVAYERAARVGRPLERPLLAVLDECANTAAPADLDGLATTAAGVGIQLVTVWHDLSQLRARYGDRADTVLNNHRAKVFLTGISDEPTLRHVSHLAGEEERRQLSVATGAEARSTTESSIYRALAPAARIRESAVGTGILIYGSLPPARIALRPWFRDRRLRALVAAAAHRPAARMSPSPPAPGRPRLALLRPVPDTGDDDRCSDDR